MGAIRAQKTEKMKSSSGYLELLTEYQPTVIKTEKENKAALAKLDRLMNKGEENWKKAEALIFELLSTLVEKFEEEAYPMGQLTSPIDSLKVLMEERGLKQADLAEIFGGQSVVSAVLKGKREINARQAKQLAEKYHYPVQVFL